MANTSFISADFWLITLAGIGIRDILFNILYWVQVSSIVQRTIVTKLECFQKPYYNPVFFGYTIQHGLSNVLFLVVGICCLLFDKGIIKNQEGFLLQNMKAIFFHNFVWEFSIYFLRDPNSFSVAFRKFYTMHHVVTLCLGLLWHFLNVFDALLIDPRLGFYTFTFMASSLLSTIGFTIRMFINRQRTLFRRIDWTTILIQHVWRLSVIIGCCIDFGRNSLKGNNKPFWTMLVSALVLEICDGYFHWKRFVVSDKNSNTTSMAVVEPITIGSRDIEKSEDDEMLCGKVPLQQ